MFFVPARRQRFLRIYFHECTALHGNLPLVINTSIARLYLQQRRPILTLLFLFSITLEIRVALHLKNECKSGICRDEENNPYSFSFYFNSLKLVSHWSDAATWLLGTSRRKAKEGNRRVSKLALICAWRANCAIRLLYLQMGDSLWFGLKSVQTEFSMRASMGSGRSPCPSTPDALARLWADSVVDLDRDIGRDALRAAYRLTQPEHSYQNGRRCKKNCKSNPRCYSGK